MTTRAVFSEHDSEPVRGLPAVLPEGERVLWQGAPNWRSLALNTYQVRTLAYYFGAMVLARGIYLLSTGSSIGDALQGCVGPAVFSLIGLAAPSTPSPTGALSFVRASRCRVRSTCRW